MQDPYEGICECGDHAKGVSARGDRLAWRAVVKSQGQQTYCGYFPKTPEGEIAAAKAHDVKARELFGEFAALNFPREGERSALRTKVA
jgi:hypothetical protein